MAQFIKNIETKDVTEETQLVVIHNQRFTKAQWDHLNYIKQLTGCEIPEYIRRLVDADRKAKAVKA